MTFGLQYKAEKRLSHSEGSRVKHSLTRIAKINAIHPAIGLQKTILNMERSKA
jgi:hypothetical protein